MIYFSSCDYRFIRRTFFTGATGISFPDVVEDAHSLPKDLIGCLSLIYVIQGDLARGDVRASQRELTTFRHPPIVAPPYSRHIVSRASVVTTVVPCTSKHGARSCSDRDHRGSTPAAELEDDGLTQGSRRAPAGKSRIHAECLAPLGAESVACSSNCVVCWDGH